VDTPAALRARLGAEIVELNVNGNAAEVLASLRAGGIAGSEAFVVGSTLTVPLPDGDSRRAAAVVRDLGLATALSIRQPTLDDVYLQLTGDRLAAAA
jgi:hypothetical protein